MNPVAEMKKKLNEAELQGKRHEKFIEAQEKRLEEQQKELSELISSNCRFENALDKLNDATEELCNECPEKHTDLCEDCPLHFNL